MNEIILASLSVLLVACSGGQDLAKREPDEYVGCATDETWHTFDTSPDVVDDTQAPVILSPTMNAMVGDTPVDVTWQPSPTIAAEPAGDIPMTCVTWNTGYTTLHLPPITGTVYDLQILMDGTDVHRVLTSLEKWTASADEWEKLSGHSVQIQLLRMVVTNGDLASGPFAPTAPLTITIAK